MTEGTDKLESAIGLLKEPVRLDPALDARVMASIESASAPRGWARRLRGVFDWLWRGRTVNVSPLGGLAVAAGIAALVVWGRGGTVPEEVSQMHLAEAERPAVQFVIIAPSAEAVSLVGDFNDWNPSATPMELVDDSRVWSVTVALVEGRYRYAFLVDGETWLRDPSAPPAQDDEFGRPGSVVTIGDT